MDVFLYNGEISRKHDLEFVTTIADNKTSDHCMVILVTPGGDPDAAYKMARYLQHRYEGYSVLVSGLCKSAGTLFAIGATEVVFAPYGELGPLDIQLTKTDQLTGMESGLNISEAFSALEGRARDTFITTTLEIIGSSGGVVSFQTAAHSAAEVVGSIYGPVFARIDPEEVGSRARAMRIGEDYGKRLNLKWNNMKPGALDLLSQTYSSHAFVIDSLEAQSLFHRVRMANEAEMQVVMDLGVYARHPQRGLTLKKLDNIGDAQNEGEAHEEATEADDRHAEDRIQLNGLDLEAAVYAESLATSGDEIAARARSKERPGTAGR
ncbi:hypothetical protein OIU34_16290 [Pararhizobium sp. BT-229]|uniref:SDH family Clp fold serine proteinase n=1 Tax=Pararhizobium sp. BT-229 TaxID=2986923 RepID=UPI0021F6F4F0|nr:hypothetical protein [Pararhizobium sp. BT-229]MCV9963464.1 hypothetical protein [Pararhizobium sp. BT-229]